MDITIHPGFLSGAVKMIPSKSQAHRLMICAAFSNRESELICPATNQDIEATAACLNALGATVTRTASGYSIHPVKTLPTAAILNCGESGSTLRFLLPVVAALGVSGTFVMTGRLPQRPLSPLWEELERMGCRLSRPTDNTVQCEGKLHCAKYSIDGSVSSQFISGLMFALSLLPGESDLQITGNVESLPYITMTRQALQRFGVCFNGERISGGFPFPSAGDIEVEGDWSNAAFFLAANALGSCIQLEGLDPQSAQGDRACNTLIDALCENITVCGKDIPDLIPILSVVAAFHKGATFQNIGRLRLKESDRIDSVANMLIALGCQVSTGADWLQVFPGKFRGCTIDTQNDHRIAMAAAIAATVASGPVTITGAQCVNKSYPDFWSEYKKLGGCYEQYIR